MRIANYYYIEKTEKELCLLADGSSVYKDELPKGAVVVKKRKSEVKVCKWAKLAGDKVLEETTLHTSFVPIIPVYGAVIWVEGKKHTHGLTRFSKDPARQYNYYQSANTELLALAPKSPYIAATGQIDNNRMQWGTANIINYPVLEYDPIDVNGNVLPPPRREPPPGTNPGFESAMNRSEMDIKAVMGMFDSTIGANESQQSGRALQTQDNRASIGNFHFNDNLKRSIKHAGRIIVEMIPKIYDTPRALSILGLDGTPQSVQVDPHAPQAVTESEDETGAVTKIFNLSAGKYSVVVDTGPTYQTRRQEAVNSQLEMCRSNPQLMQIAGDLIVKNMDWLGAEDIADRLKLMLPPQVLADIKQKESGQQANDPAIEQQMNKMADMVQHLSQELQAAKSGQQEALEKLEIERYRAQTERAKVDAEIGFKDAELVHEGIKLTHDMAMADLQHTLATQQVLAESQEDEGQENETPANAQNADAGASTPPAQPAPTAEQPAANSSGDVQ